MFDAGPLDPVFLPLPQSDAYAVAARVCGARAVRVDLGCGSALVLERPGRRLVTRGPVWLAGTSDAEKRKALRHLARFPGVTLATPEAPVSGFGLVPLITPAHVAIWDLAGDIRAGMAGKWRNRLSAAERVGLRVQRGTKGLLDRLLVQDAAQRAARGYRALPPGFVRALPGRALRLWEWRQAGQTEAGMAFVVEGAVASYHLSWASGLARSRGVATLMLARAAAALQEEGVRWLDLGTVDTEAAPGLARFKLGTGASLRRLGATVLVLPG